MRAWWFGLIWGCNAAALAEETDLGVLADTDVEAPDPPLTAGFYVTYVVAYENDACGTFATDIGLTACDTSLIWSGEDRFELDGFTCDPTMPPMPCDLDEAGAVSCAGYVQNPWNIGSGAQVVFTSVIPEFTILGPDSFEMLESYTVECVGSGCASAATKYGATWPCHVDVREHYAKN